MITQVTRGSIAGRLRLAAGDILLKINDKEVTTVDQLRRALDRPAGRRRITFRRGGEVRTLVVG